MISLEERGKINKQLKQLGFGGINDANLFSQIACLYRTHDSFRGLLMSTAPDQRRIAYEALKPHLCFVAKPLDQYEREIHEKAEREQWDVIDPGNPHFPRPFKVSELRATEALRHPGPNEKTLTLTCAHCLKEEKFHSWSRMMADMKATQAGWYSKDKKSWCPDHKPPQ